MESQSGPVGVPVGDSISEPVWDPDRGRSGVKNGDSIFGEMESPSEPVGFKHGDSIFTEMESPTGALGC